MKHKKMQGLIGVFDSGFGGLMILRHIVKHLPQFDYTYLGDSLRAPYGNRSPEAIYQCTKEAVDFLVSKKCSLIIIACNTASSEALRKIQQEYLLERYPNRRVLGVLIPAAEAAVLRTKNGRAGVIGTERTVASGAFPRELKKLKPAIRVFQHACPLLVPLVESGETDKRIIRPVLISCLAPLIKKNIDTLILGCTHYGVLEREIQSVVGKGISVVSEGTIVAEKLATYLERHPEVASTLTKTGTRRFYTTDRSDTFKKIGSKIFGSSIKPETVELQKFTR